MPTTSWAPRFPTDAHHQCHDVRVRQLGGRPGARLPDGKSESKGYDGAGNLISRTDFAGQTTTYDYDQNNRLTSRSYPDASQASASPYTATAGD